MLRNHTVGMRPTSMLDFGGHVIERSLQFFDHGFEVVVDVDDLEVKLPDYPPIVGKPVWLEQNWQPGEREWFHYKDQGTQTFHIPCEWFVALEQPVPSLGKVAKLSDAAYLDRFGFIPGSADGGEHKLPIGMAQGDTMVDWGGAAWKNPRKEKGKDTGKDMTRIGLTCAACHTGRFTYRQTTVLVDGGRR